MYTDKDPVSLGKGKALKRTARALLVALEDRDGEELWFPCSVIHDDSEVYDEGDEGEMIVESWFAEKEGLA